MLYRNGLDQFMQYTSDVLNKVNINLYEMQKRLSDLYLFQVNSDKQFRGKVSQIEEDNSLRTQ